MYYSLNSTSLPNATRGLLDTIAHIQFQMRPVGAAKFISLISGCLFERKLN